MVLLADLIPDVWLGVVDLVVGTAALNLNIQSINE